VRKGQRKVHWIAWEKLLSPNWHDGLGFRDMRLFNQALLARQAWRLIQFPDSLCAQLLKAKYYPRGVLVDTVFTGDASPTWRSIEHGLELLKKGIIWRIGSGSKVQIWRPMDTSSTFTTFEPKEGMFSSEVGISTNGVEMKRMGQAVGECVPIPP
jgi:hypothetical protein